MSSLFQSFTVKGINNELVIESIEKGIIKWFKGLEVLAFNNNCNNIYCKWSTCTCCIKDPNIAYNPNIVNGPNIVKCHKWSKSWIDSNAIWIMLMIQML